jgi:RNA polymerase sigma factor (sigma-70 family)
MTEVPQPTDAQLLEQFAFEEQESAFNALIGRHGPMVLGVCRRVLQNEKDAEEALQSTFLLLARKASSIRKKESIASWLYGVAFRVSVRWRKRSELRSQREISIQEAFPHEEPSQQSHESRSWNEVQAILDEELNQLPEKHRTPLVLCYLQGKTNEEVAGELGCPLGSMHHRINQARELLRQRLVKRGLTLSSTLFLGMVAEHSVQAAVPAHVMTATSQAALQVASGETLSAGTVSAKVLGGMQEMARWFFLQKVGITMAGLVAVGGLGVSTISVVREMERRSEMHQNQLNSALIQAVEQRNLEQVEALLLKGADANARNAKGISVAMLSMFVDDIAILRLLDEHGARLESDRFSFLALAAGYGRLQTVEYLVKNGANLEWRSSAGETPVFLAAANGRLETVQLLARLGANLTLQNYWSEHTTTVAAKYGNGEVLAYLKGQGVPYEPNLWTAAGMGDLSEMKKLIQKGADVNLKDRANGYTPLMYAARASKVDAVKCLLQNGANVNFVNNKGKHVLDAASTSPEIHKILMEAGAKPQKPAL